MKCRAGKKQLRRHQAVNFTELSVPCVLVPSWFPRQHSLCRRGNAWESFFSTYVYKRSANPETTEQRSGICQSMWSAEKLSLTPTGKKLGPRSQFLPKAEVQGSPDRLYSMGKIKFVLCWNNKVFQLNLCITCSCVRLDTNRRSPQKPTRVEPCDSQHADN